MSSRWASSPRIIQTNLQVADTGEIDPERLAEQISSLGGNTLVFNVGGIYAWYDTDVDFHTRNPYLPAESDLLENVIEACHSRDIAFVGRVDFSKADDEVYAHNPTWFARTPDGDAKTIGAERPGNWPILRYTCLNSAYRKDAVALPVLDELLSRFDLDGIFYNAPHYIPCHCDACQRKYRARYGEALPDDPDEFRDDWPEQCVEDNMTPRYDLIKDRDADVEMVLYYHSNGKGLLNRAATTDFICTESQNVLSRGRDDLPEKWKPSRTMKVGNAAEDGPLPVGIIHSSPGMDWRHTGLPPAEYEFWLSQIPANGGTIWHSLTGVPDTIGDDRLLETVETVNRKTAQAAALMENATSAARTVLLWDDSRAAHGLIDGLTQRQIPFDLLLPEQADADRLADYELVVVPAGWEYAPDFAAALRQFVSGGGRVLVEGDLPDDADELFAALGVAGNTQTGDELVASYSRFEGEANPLQRDMEATELLPHRGQVAYCDPAEDAEALLTLVPQWSPLEAVGRPPERASLHVSHTDIPMAVARDDGRSLYFPFALSTLLSEYGLGDHYRLLENAVAYLLGERRFVESTSRQGLQLVPFETEDGFLVHLVNGVGQRPLTTRTPLPESQITLSIGAETEIVGVQSLFSGDDVDFARADDAVTFTAPQVDVWEAVHVQCEPAD